MNHFAKLAVVLFLAAIAPNACKCSPEATDTANSPRAVASGAQSSGTAEGSGDFSDVTNKDWRLAELRRAGRTVTINRTPPASFATVDLSDWFTLRFVDGQVSGRAAPNNYGAPYTQADNQAITIGLARTTMMASFYQLEELKEQEFFAYLQNVSRWNLAGGNLELYSRGADDSEAVLVFAPAQ